MARIKTLAFYFARLLQPPLVHTSRQQKTKAASHHRSHLELSDLYPARKVGGTSSTAALPIERGFSGSCTPVWPRGPFPTETPGTSASSSSGYYGLGTCNFEFLNFYFFISIIFLGKTGSPLPQVPHPLQHHLELPAIREPTGLSFAPKILLFALFPQSSSSPSSF